MDLIHLFLEYLRVERGYSGGTVKAYSTDLAQWAEFATSGKPGELDAASITVQDLRLWVGATAGTGVSPRTIRRKISSLRSFYHYLMAHHAFKSNPAAALTMPKMAKEIPVYIRAAETKAIINDTHSAGADFSSVRNNLIIELLYTTGIRCTELITLRDSDVDTRRGELKVLGKRNKERVVPFGRQLAETIDTYRALRDSSPLTAISSADSASPLLVKDDGAPLYRKMVYNIVHSILAEGGAHATRLSPHVLRHSCATDMLNAGAPIASVQQMLGHASLASTQVYTHVTYKDLKNNYQLAHPRAQKKGGPNGH